MTVKQFTPKKTHANEALVTQFTGMRFHLASQFQFRHPFF